MTQRLSGLDSAFLSLETTTAPLHVTGLATLDPQASGEPAAFEAVRAHLAPRLRAFPIFRRHLLSAPLELDHPSWQAGDLDPDAHLKRVAVPAPGGSAQLAALAGHLAARPLERDRPLWEIWFIEGLDGNRTALLCKMHHALIDGVAGAAILGRLFDVAPDVPAAPVPKPLDRRRNTREREQGAPTAPKRIAGAVVSFATAPLALARQVVGGARAAFRARRAIAATPRPDEPADSLLAGDSPLNGAISARREVALGSVSLSELREITRHFDVKINDVVLTVCAGALRRYLRGRGHACDRPLIAGVPVSVRSAATDRSAGNGVSAMLVELPVHLHDPVCRLVHVHRSSLRAKRAHAAAGGDLFSGWAEAAPPLFVSGLSELYSRLDVADRHRPLVNLIVSNVRSPGQPLYCAGHRLRMCVPLGPIYESCALNVTAMSYDERLHVGLLACPDVVSDVDRLPAAIGDAVSELLGIVHGGTVGARDAARARRPTPVRRRPAPAAGAPSAR